MLRLLAVVWLLALPATLRPEESKARAVLEKHCLSCHGSARMSDLDLRQRESILHGGKRGPAVVPGNPEASLLFRAVSGKAEFKMPPGKESLTPEEQETLRLWIRNGAALEDAGHTHPQEPSWWSFRKLKRPPVPQVAGTANPIDAFLTRTLQEKGLTPAPPADRRTLIRRVYFDLVGLPPEPERVERFVKDPAPDAYAKLIDELLSSPRYGERWGRHWLDVVRYADSGGYETDIYYRNAWRYRDYVIDSFNSDKPFDRFVQEQIAGDEIWPDNLDMDGTYKLPAAKVKHLEARIGTGFFALGPETHESNMDARKLQYEKETDWVDTVGAAFLGLTFGCARCHDHKFDPILQRDYYSMAAIFAYSTEVEIPVVHRMSIRDHDQHYPRLVAVAEAKVALREFDAKIGKREKTPEEKAERNRLLEQIGKAVSEVPEKDAQQIPYDGLMDIPTATVLGHREPELVPKTYVYGRGDLDSPKEKVSASLPSFLGGGDLTGGDCTGRCIPLARKRLALWLTQPDHPLTSRVIVNRIWQWHFGRGLVATPNDFGRQGQPPSHPELLDWLAAEFVARGWSFKNITRLILLSDAYQRASRFQNAQNQRLDPENRYLWRANRQRLEGEELWDGMHSAAGTLNLKTGGRPVVPPLSKDELTSLGSTWQWPVSSDPAEWNRRGVYILVRRNFIYPMFDAFDSPITAVSCPVRDTTSVAPQALWLLNNKVSFEQAKAFAARLKKQYGEVPARWVEGAWQLALGRPATTQEVEEGAAPDPIPLARKILPLGFQHE